MKAKRLLSLLLTLMMVLSCLSGFAVSAGAETTAPAALPEGTIFVDLSWTESNTPASITVNGKSYNLTWGTNAYNAAQTALDAAPAGGTVYLCAGTYGGFNIQKNLTVLGAKYGIDPNVKGTNETDLWTKNSARGTGETIINGNISMGVNGTTIYHAATDMTVDGVQLTGEGQIRSNAAAKNNNGLVKITLKNFYIKDSTKTTAPLYLQPYYGMSAPTDNQYQRDVTIKNVRVEGLTKADLMVLTAEKADISGIYMHTDCSRIFFSTASAATGYTSAVEWNIHDNMFANPVGRTIYVDSQNAKGNSQSLVSDLADRSKVTFNFKGNIFVNSFIASGTNSAFTLAFRPATQNVYLNFDGNVFYNTKAPGSTHSCIAGYATVSADYSDQITVTNNKMIGKIVNGFSFGQIGGSSLDVSGNYTCIDGKVSHFICTCINKQDWWWMDQKLTERSDGANIPAERLVDIENDVKWLGRTYVADNRHYFNWTHSGFEFNIDGTGATALLSSSCPSSNKTYLKIYVDGVETETIHMTAPVMTVTLAEGLSDGPHTIKVVKRTNGRSGTAALMKLWVDEGTEILKPNKPATRKIQFLGDSITVGYGSMDWLSPSAWSTDSEDGTITYAALTSKYFGADNHTIAVSGRGVIWNTGSSKDTANHAPLMYEYWDWNDHKQWNHSLYQPDVVVINLGTNDRGNITNDADHTTFKNAVYNLIAQVRKDNPNAHIIWAYGAMGDSNNVESDIKAMVAKHNSEGDSKVSYITLTKGTTCLGHPTSAAHQTCATELIAKVKEVTGWDEHKTCEYTENIVTEPTCGDKGYAEYTCKVCGDYYEAEIQPTGEHITLPTVHPYEGQEPTCNTPGKGYKKCMTCGQATHNNVTIPATGEHTEGDIIPTLAPTCGKAGAGRTECTACGTVINANAVIPATGKHSWNDGRITTKPTTTKEGVKTFTCTVCGATKTEKVAKLPAEEEKEQPKVNFTDVKKKDFYYNAVQWAVANGVTTGTGPKTFSPNESCTRAQAVTFLWRAAGQPTAKNAKNPFTDVKKSDYYYKAVLWAAENGVTSGTSATKFSPNENCTRGQIVTFLWRAQSGKKVSAKNPFSDVKKSDFYYNAVLWAVKNGVTTGTSSTTFGPAENCTRGQIVTFLHRAVAK